MGAEAFSAGVVLRDGVAMERLLLVNADGSINTTPVAGEPQPIEGQAVTIANSGQTSIPNTATQIFALNATRRGAFIQNHSTTDDLYLGWDDTVTTANAPIKIPPGGSLRIAQFALYYTGAIWGIRASGSDNAGHFEETV